MSWAPTPAHEYANWPAWRIADPHARHLWQTRHNVSAVQPNPSFLNAFGSYTMFALGDYSAAEPLWQRALEARERVLGPKHPDTLISVNDLAVLYANQGKFREAEPLLARVLESLERILGPDHPNTRTCRENFANVRAGL